MTTLDLSGLDRWPEDKAGRARELLMKYHGMFSLDDSWLGCAGQIEHSIRVTGGEPFRERF